MLEKILINAGILSSTDLQNIYDSVKDVPRYLIVVLYDNLTAEERKAFREYGSAMASVVDKQDGT